jgi:hypothetical protein
MLHHALKHPASKMVARRGGWKGDEMLQHFHLPVISRAAAISADGRRLAAGDYAGALRLWELKSEGRTHVVSAHRGLIECAVFSPAHGDAVAPVRQSESENGPERGFSTRRAPVCLTASEIPHVSRPFGAAADCKSAPRLFSDSPCRFSLALENSL